jgi:hypothetical protein
MAKMKTIVCACGCKQTREVRVSDVRRGWGKYIDKSHKARHQERKTGQYAALKQRAHGMPSHGQDYEGMW